MLCASKLSQHAISQSEARVARYAIPACSILDKLSQHAVNQLKARETKHTAQAGSGSQSQIGKSRQSILAYTVQVHYPSIHTDWVSSVGRAVDCHVTGPGFNTHS